jgi:hypothetical protein
VLLWIVVDVDYESGKVTIIVHENSAKGFFKQAAGALVRLVERLGMRTEQLGKGVACLQGPVVLMRAGLAVLRGLPVL